MVQISKAGLVSASFIILGILTLIITLAVNNTTMSSGVKGGCWSGFVFILIGLGILVFLHSRCDSSSNMGTDMGGDMIGDNIA